MPPRQPLIEANTIIVLKDGVRVSTQYDTATANSYPLERHRKACKRQQEEKLARQFRSTNESEELESFDLQLLFRPPLASFDSDRAIHGMQVECPGQWVQWSPGSIWETYPFRLHKSKEVGWTPIKIDGGSNGLVVRAKRCWKLLDESDTEDGPMPCVACKMV
ncbi:hypothetical protein Agabi119p4_3891 [Agaricus bisporus var. burnettii]|uniref:Uncharacterized protein n=1 Tax=Agaricus bisporus var. burnettii TaxID=192524 RepID=A0A8H7KIE5_AGABI|nr:hypothetical protein Agabi119p4_3891 [Agaricus bisporus var. burnettii]